MAGDSIKQSTISGMRWLALKSLLGESVTVASTVVLARLVSPAEFGHAAVALLFVPLAVILTFEGFASALVQRETIDERYREVAVLMSMSGGLVLTCLLLATVPVLWRPVFGGETGDLVALISPIFVIAGVGSVSRATLWRRLAFRLMTIVDIVSGLIGAIVSVVLAAMGFGAKALVVGGLAMTAASSVLMLIAAPEPFPRWHRAPAREIRKFGVPAALAGLVWMMWGNVDYWILAARLTAYQTGIYYRAFNIGVVYQSKISNVMMQLAFPVYSRISDRREMSALHERATRIHAAVLFPCLTALIATAPVIIPFAFGAEWEPAVRPCQILAVAGMIAAVLTGYGQVMLAVGRPRRLLYFNIAVLLTYAAAVAAACSHGLIFVTIVVAGVYVLILLAVYRYLLGPSLGLSITSLLPGLGPAVAGSLALLAASVPLRIFLEHRLPAPLTFCIVILAGAAVYLVVLRTMFRSTWTDLRRLAIKVLPWLEQRKATPPRDVGTDPASDVRSVALRANHTSPLDAPVTRMRTTSILLPSGVRKWVGPDPGPGPDTCSPSALPEPELPPAVSTPSSPPSTTRKFAPVESTR